MLILHQTGTLKVGEVIRYTVTYTPSLDPILPSPPQLYLKIRNTSAIALRAAFVHGPYTLYVSAAPEGYRTDEKWKGMKQWGVPEFELNVKAGASWSARLNVPESVRGEAGRGDTSYDDSAAEAAPIQGQVVEGKGGNDEENPHSVSWVIEVASQVVFSTSAAVHYEVLIGRGEKSLNLGLGSGIGALNIKPNPVKPGEAKDHTGKDEAEGGHQRLHMKGVYSRAIKLKVEDTAALWNCPKLPEWEDEGAERSKTWSKTWERKLNMRNSMEEREQLEKEKSERVRKRKQKKVHLVVVTHGLHSNLGADMLYLKESIDGATQEAKAEAKKRRAERRQEEKERAAVAGKSNDEQLEDKRTDGVENTKPPAQQKEGDPVESEDEEEVIVRGFSGNAVRTEKGIKYLGKRLAKYVLAMTYPDQPFRSVARTPGQIVRTAVKRDNRKEEEQIGEQAHSHSSIRSEPISEDDKKLAYKITSISFIAHSLGGLTQTYAVAYIQKHSPDFFDKIRGVNFITLATPFLGLSNENPLYVKFALDFGLVGRTGQDLGLTWRAPNIARSGWGALVSGIGEGAKHKAERPQDPGSKPLLRILPTGPAHVALKKFRNRTVYSNVVNDGIVPLRTSCLLFLDWQGLGRVEKARRENGVVGTMANWGWQELTGQNSSAAARKKWIGEMEGQEAEDANPTVSSDANGDENGDGSNTPIRQGKGDVVPQPPRDAIDADTASIKDVRLPESVHFKQQKDDGDVASTATTKGPLDTIMDFFTPKPSKPGGSKQRKIYQRSQTMNFDSSTSLASSQTESTNSAGTDGKPKVAGAPPETEATAPPRTSFFEAAGDLLAPPLPPLSFLVDPSSRPRAIFHDRVYHPEDIPAPPRRKNSPPLPRRRTESSVSKDSSASSASTDSGASVDTLKGLRSGTFEDETSGLKVEEKIARAYHRDLSWRKVLVRLQPDAHNNIIVRRKFANAYGWPVVKHLCDTHFSDFEVSRVPDYQETNEEKATAANEAPTAHGREVNYEAGQRGDGEQEPAEHQFLNPAYRRSTSGQQPRDTSAVEQKSPALGLPSNLKVDKGRQPSQRTRTMDSQQWSDNDFMDSDNESEFDPATGSPLARPLLLHTASNPNIRQDGQGWNWTEKIVGKGATHPNGQRTNSRRSGSGPRPTLNPAVGRLKSESHIRGDSMEFSLPTPMDDDGELTPTQSNVDPNAFQKHGKVVGEPELELVTNQGEADGHLGLGIVPVKDADGGYVERVARLSVGGGPPVTLGRGDEVEIHERK